MNQTQFANRINAEMKEYMTNQPIPFEIDTPPTKWRDDYLPPLMANAVKAIAEHVKAPLALAGFAVLSAVAHIAQRLTDAPKLTGGSMPCSLFTLALAESGARKSECFNLSIAPIMRNEVEKRCQHQIELQKMELEAAAAKPKDRAAILAQATPDPRTIYRDATLEKIIRDFVKGSRPALTWASDEGGVMLGGHSMKSETCRAALANLTKLFDGAGAERDRIGEGQSGFRPNARFGLFLSAQQATVKEALNDPLMREQGFLPRFLLSAPESLVGTRFIEPEDLNRRAHDDPRLMAYWEILEKMNARPEPIDENGTLALPTAHITPDAAELWRQWFNQTEAHIGQDGEYSHIKPFGGRAGELARRIATVFACWQQFEQGLAMAVIDNTAMQSAIRLCDYSLKEWARYLVGSKLTQAEQDAKMLLEFFQRKHWDTFTRSRVAQECPISLRGSNNKQKRNNAIDELIARRWLQEESNFLILVPLENLKSRPATAISATSATASPDAVVGSSNLGKECFADGKVSTISVPLSCADNSTSSKSSSSNSENEYSAGWKVY